MNNFNLKTRKNMYKNSQIKVLSNQRQINGLECTEFDNIIDTDIKKFYDNLSNDRKATNITETLRRLKLLKIAKQISLDRNKYFDLKHYRNKDFMYSSRNPKYLELYEFNRLLTNSEYLRYLQKSKLVNDIRNAVFKEISDNLYVDEAILDIVKETTQEANTATSSSNAILSNNGSQDQERVKDKRLRNNQNLEKYQHNTKWIIFSKMEDGTNSTIYQLPKMNGKYHTEFCLRYFIPDMILEDNNYENSLCDMVILLNILLNIREHYNEFFLKVLKDNVINVFEGLSFDMQCILSPSMSNIKNIHRAKGIRKIVNLPISRNEKIKMLMEFKYYNKFQEPIYPFHPSNKYRIIINSSYHFVKDTSLKPTLDNPNCVANGFLAKFKLSFGIYQVSNNSILHKNFLKIKENDGLKTISTNMFKLIKENYYTYDLDEAICLIQNIKNENDINEWSNITPITVWMHEFLSFSKFSRRLYHKLFPKSVSLLKITFDVYDQRLQQIVTDEIYIRKNLVRTFLTKYNKKLLNEITYSGREPSASFTKQIMKVYNSLIDSSSKILTKYLNNYMQIIDSLDDIHGHLLFNHMIKRYSYFMDTKCFIDSEMNSCFFKTTKNYAFPMFTKAFSNILKKKKLKISDELFIYNSVTKADNFLFENDTEEIEKSDNISDDITLEYLSDDESLMV